MNKILQLLAYLALCLSAALIAWVNSFDSAVPGTYVNLVVPLLLGAFVAYILWMRWTDYLDCKSLAVRGDLAAMYDLAVFLKEVDVKTAIYWAEKSALRGHDPAEFLAGFLRYRAGLRDSLTFDFLLRAAKRGEEAAMRAVANCYKTGHGVLPSDRLAFEWRMRSALSGETQLEQAGDLFGGPKPKGWVPGYLLSRYAVGLCYLSGDGCAKNIVEGYAWLQLAAHEGLIVARQRMRSLDSSDLHEFRYLVQERSLALSLAIAKGQDLTPVAADGAVLPKPPSDSQATQLLLGRSRGLDASQSVSAWRAFLTVFLVGNLVAAIMTLGAKGDQRTPIRGEVYGVLYCSFLASAFVAASYGRKMHPAIHFLLLAVSSMLFSAAFAYWYSPSFVWTALGAVLAAQAFVLPVAVPLIHWRSTVSTVIFYALIVLHLLGLAVVFLR
jgi:TPR repeat protein